MPGWRPILRAALTPTAITFSWSCWPTTSTAGCCCSSVKPTPTPEKLRHTTLATARLRFLFVAAKIWRHAGRTGISYSDQYQEQGLFERLMRRLRAMAPAGIELRAGGGGCAALRGAPCIKFYALAASYWEHAVCEPAFARPDWEAAQTGRETAEKTTC